jgi:predicted transcriptional regulator
MRLHTHALLCFALASSVTLAAEPGETLKPVELKNYDEATLPIPDFGKKVIALFYGDADVSDQNDPLADALSAKNFDKQFYRGLGVANLQDSKAPNFIIRGVVKSKVEKYKSVILLDPNLALATAWGLGDCNNTSVIVVIGPDMKVKYLHKGPVRGAEVDSTVKLVEAMVNELKGAATPTP